jgi:hypothetical protein
VAEQTNSPGGDDTVLPDLDHEVRTELTLAERSGPGEETDRPVEEWLFDPADVERAEIGLRSLLGAVEAVEAPRAHPHGSHLAARDHCLSLVRAVDRPTGAARYGRMFPGLSPLGTDPQLLVRAGADGGICDGAAFLDAGGPDDDATGAAGWPFFGQLVAHDITADRSPVGAAVEAGALRNARSPRLDLEIIYADGPVGSPYLFDVADPASFLLAAGGADVPRNPQGVALIGDPRDDVHLFALALHTALLRAHNAVVELLRADGVPEAEVFDRARVTLTWHYQWIVVHDFLPRLVGRQLVEQVLAEGGRWFAPASGAAFIPLEFADAAYRYGHGQIRHSYRLVDGGPAVPLFPDLVGFGPLPPDRRLDLAQVFDLPGRAPAQRAKRLDGRLAASLIGLPEQVTGAVDAPAYRSLAVRDLLRGRTTELPSGEAVARLLGVEPLADDETGRSWPHGTPLWFYVLKEAELRGGGDRLGPVGGRIVAEVLIGLLRADPASQLSLDPSWTPTLPAAGPGFALADLLTLDSAR